MLKKVMKLSNRLVRDRNGSFAVGWAVSLLAIVVAIGSAYDTSQAAKARKLAQIAADSMALSASIAVDRGNTDRFEQGTEYNYGEIGGPVDDFTDSMKGSVEYDVPDGTDKLIARATITGEYSTAFMGIIGVKKIPLRAISDVAYAAEQGVPASIFFVADNSGSMGDYDSNGILKITSLENSLKDFMDTLETLDDDGTYDIFRTALYPYSADPNGSYSSVDDDGVIPAHVVSPKWGPMNDGNITQMQYLYGTDSSGALQDAADDFDLEGAIHNGVNGTSTPLKFMVFMTDGANNQSNECRALNEDEEYWIDTYNNWNTLYLTEQYWFDGWVVHHEAGSAGYEDQSVCGWDYHFDRRSLEACTQMKQSGVSVYAIAYDVASGQKDHAEAFMKSCSSGDEYFKSASDSTALEAAFVEIGESILTELIRIKH